MDCFYVYHAVLITMEPAARFNKATMRVGSAEYDRLLAEEIKKWSVDQTQNKGGWEGVRTNQIQFRTYRSGTIETQIEAIEKQGTELRILELGGSDGWFSNEILRLPEVASVTTIDAALRSQIAQTYDSRVQTIAGDLNKIDKIAFPKNNATFNCIITRGTLHHLVNPKETLEYAIDHLLITGGIVIIDDTWTPSVLQLKLNAFGFILLGRLPQSLVDWGKKRIAFVEMLGCLAASLGHLMTIPLSRQKASRFAHNEDFSPFEGISDASNYKSIYQKKDTELVYFKNFAALPALYHTYPARCKIVERLLFATDKLLIKGRLMSGDSHIAILRKK